MKSYDNYSSDNGKLKPREFLEGKQDTLGDRFIILSGQNNPSRTETINIFESIFDKTEYQTWFFHIQVIRIQLGASDRYLTVTLSLYPRYRSLKICHFVRSAEEEEGQKRHINMNGTFLLLLKNKHVTALRVFFAAFELKLARLFTYSVFS